MGIHLDRNDFLQGVNKPENISPEFIGQFYIDTGNKIIYQNIDGTTAGWRQISQQGHTHEAKDFVWMKDVVEELVDENYINEAIESLRTTNNHWLGVNNFSDIRKNGQQLLSEGSKLEDFANVLVDPKNMKVGHVLGWTGSGWGLYAPDGTLPTGDTTDFSHFLVKTDVINSLSNNSPDKPLAAAQGVAIKNYVDQTFANKEHSHGDIYASKFHSHDGFLEKDGVNTVEGQLIFSDTEGVIKPLSFTSDGGTLAFKVAATEEDIFALELDRNNSSDGQSLYIGGSNGVIGTELTLNFGTVRIPSGKILTDTEGQSLRFSPIKITPGESVSPDGSQYVMNLSRKEYGVHLNNTALVGVNQIVFNKPSRSMNDAILFPRSYAGYAQPTELGQYNYLYILDDKIHTDATLATTQKFIQVAGRKIFFTSTEPGRESEPGDIWIKV